MLLVTVKDIKGIASNHGDPKNWFPKHGKGMDTFRADVKKLLSEGEKPAEQEKRNIIVCKSVPIL